MAAPILAYRNPLGGRGYRHPQTGQKVPSITTIIGCLDKPALVPAAAKLNAEYAVKNWDALSALDDPARVDAIKGHYRSQWYGKADLGTRVHEVGEAWAKDEPLPPVDPDMRGMVASLLAFLDDSKPEFMAIEATVWSETHGYAGTLDFIALIDEQVCYGDYKDLAVDTPLATPTGWTTVGDVQVGQQVLGSDGMPVTVTGKSDVYTTNQCYRVVFDDGTELVAGADHGWTVLAGSRNARQRSVPQRVTVSTEQLRQIRGAGVVIRVPNTAPLDLPDQPIDVDPYVLGAWLGDGRATSGELCKPSPELWAEIEARGYAVGPDISSGDRAESRTIYGLRTQLGRMGMLGQKHLPTEVLRSSRKTRLDVLRGLMDTDGYWHPTRQRAVMSTTQEWQAQAVYDLAVSLGWKATVFRHRTTGFGKEWDAIQVCFTPTDDCPFLVRAPQGWEPAGVFSRERMVKAVIPVDSVPTQCIAVDAPDHLFLAGRAMVPTHNTGKAVYPEVGMQIAAAVNADYIITGTGERIDLPACDRAVAVSIRPQGYTVHEVTHLDESFQGFLGLLAAYRWKSEVADGVLQ